MNLSGNMLVVPYEISKQNNSNDEFVCSFFFSLFFFFGGNIKTFSMK